MTIRTLLLPTVLLTMLACSPADETNVPVATTIPIAEGGAAWNPLPSPDGTRLLWTAAVGGRSAVYVGGLDGSDPVRLTHGVWDFNPRWSPDGSMIAYESEEGWDVMVVPSTGGESRRLTTGPAREQVGEWLADGSGLLVYREGAGSTHTLMVLLDGSPERRIGPEVAGDQWVTLSPDGSMLAYDLHEGGRGTIWVQALDGSAPRQLTTEGLEGGTTREMWSPDGTRLLFQSRRTGTLDLWTANVATGELRQLTSDLRDDTDYSWSPDGKWVLFRSDRGGQWDLWIVPSEGGTAHRVTNDADVEDLAVWSPDGAQVFYVSISSSSALQELPLSGGASRTLFEWPNVELDDAVVSPDGETVLFTSNRSGNPDIWQVQRAGGEPTPFVAGPLAEGDPHYAPDGSAVVFTSDRGGSNDVWRIPAAGGEPVRLTDWPSNEIEPRWSPDGSLIVFRSNHETASSSRYDLWVVAATGGEPRRVTSFAGTAWNARWSLDGEALYFLGETGPGQHDLFRIAVDGGTPEAIGVDPEAGGGALSPDGDHFAYVVYRGGWAFIEVIPTAGGPSRRLTPDSTGVYQYDVWWSPDGSRLFVQGQDLEFISESVLEMTWPEGVWRSLTTSSPRVAFDYLNVMPDGEHLLVERQPFEWRVMSTPLVELLSGP